MSIKTLVGILLLFSVLLCGYAGLKLMLGRTPADEPAPSGTSVSSDVKPKAREEARPTEARPVEGAVDAVGAEVAVVADEPVEAEHASASESLKKDARPPKEGKGSVTATVTRVDKSVAVGFEFTLYHLTWGAHEPMDEDGSTWRAVTDDEGKFRVEGLPMGRFGVLCHMEGETVIRNFVLSKAKPDANFPIEMWETGNIAGVVKNTAGAPVANAEVFAYDWEGEGGQMLKISPYESFFTRCTTDEAGYFLIGPYCEGTFRLCVKAQGYATLISDEVEADGTEFTLVVSKGASASGEIVYADSGEPVGGMKLTLAGLTGVALQETVSDESGLFLFADLPAGEQWIVIDDESMVIKPGTGKFSVAAGRDLSGLRVELEEGGVITGRIYDEGTDAGLSGVDVQAYSLGIESIIPRKGTTDRDGNYRLEGLASATFEVSHREVKGYGTDWQRSRKRVSAKAGDTVPDIDFALSAGLRILGTVEDEEGLPIAGVSVNANKSRYGGNSQHVSTEEDGSFILAGLSPSTEYSLSVYKNKMAALPIEDVQIGSEDVEGVRIVMTTASVLAGTVVDRNGKLLADIRVHAKNLDMDARGDSDRTESNGAFELSRLAAGQYGILLSRDGVRRTDMPYVMEVTLAKGEEMRGLRLVYEGPEGMSISGRVTDRKGKPLENASLDAHGGQSYGNGQTNKDGEYEISGLAEGNYSVNVHHGKYSGAYERDIPAGSTDIDFVLAGRGTASGTVVDARSNKPVTDFEMYQTKGMRHKLDAWMGDNFRSFHDNEGRFSLNNLEEGDATIIVRANGYAPAFESVSGVVEDETIDDIEIRMEPGVSLDGTVADSAGNPVANAKIYSGPVPNEWGREREAVTTTKSDGSFHLESLHPGTNTFGAYHADFTPAQIDIDLSANRKNTVHITLTMGGVVEGVVTQGGSPVEGQHVGVNLPSGGGRSNSAQTDANGYYSIAGLPEGEVSVYCSISKQGGSHRSKHTSATIVSERVTVVDFDFSLATASVEGIVYGSEDAPLAQVHISGMVDEEGAMENFGAQTDANGYYLLENLPAGTVTLMTYAQGHSPRSVQVELTNGQRAYKDILLYGGATIMASVSNAPQTARGVQIAVFRGDVEIPQERTQESMMALWKNMASAGELNEEGVAQLANLEPGVYTVMAIAMPNMEGIQGPGDVEEMFARMQFATEVITIEKEEEQLNINLSF